MSLSKPKLTNPCKKFIEFKGDSGIFRYWDKSLEKNVELESPIKFIVLDELSTITGFNDFTQSGVFSNEIRSLKHNILKVRTFKGKVSVSGIYEDIKSDIQGMGGKFTKSVYVALVNGDEVELANFQLKGASFKAWIDKEINTQLVGVLIENYSDAKKGKVSYKVPVYASFEIPEALMKKAVEMDKMLQEYLGEYIANNEEVVEKEKPAEKEDDDKIPF
jgi:hypothetical protein